MSAFYLTKSWSVADPTPPQSVYLDYLEIKEVPEQLEYIHCGEINEALGRMSAHGLSSIDSNDVKLYLNYTFQRSYSYAYYNTILTHCSTYASTYVLPQRGTEKDGRFAYRFGFNGKEQDNEMDDWQDYGERIYMRRLGRFPSPDPLTKKYPMLTPYQFASNTPIQAVDLDGLEAFYVHGTWSNPTTFSKLAIATINQILGNTTGKEFKWSGYNTDRARRKAARDLANHIIKHRDPNQPLTLIGHSHGGNVVIMAANILKRKGIQVDNILTINTPVREYQLDKGATKKHVNIYQHHDPVQGGGGNTVNIPDHIISFATPVGPLLIATYEGSVKGTGEMGPAGRTFENAVNIDVPFDRNNVHNTHNTYSLWKNDLNAAVNPAPLQPVDPKLPDIEPTKQDNTYVAPSTK